MLGLQRRRRSPTGHKMGLNGDCSDSGTPESVITVGGINEGRGDGDLGRTLTKRGILRWGVGLLICKAVRLRSSEPLAEG